MARSSKQAAMKAKKRAAAPPSPAPPVDDPQIDILVATRPRRAIDSVIERLREKTVDPERALQDLARAVYAARSLEEASVAPAFADLFRSRLSKDDRRFVAACLMRALAADRGCVSEEIMRRHYRDWSRTSSVNASSRSWDYRWAATFSPGSSNCHTSRPKQ
jgi:hypothetical protein